MTTHPVSALVAALDALSPFAQAEKWDNVGLLVGDPEAPITRVLCCIDCTAPVIDEAEALGANVIVAYHPVIFEGQKRVLAGSLVWRLVRAGIAVVSPHTALDLADGGTNDMLGDVVALTSRAPLRVTDPRTGRGMGRVGPCEPITREALFANIRAGLGVDKLLVAGPTEGLVRRVAVGAGACGDMVNDALASGAELYLTGELRHHDALKCAARGMTVVCALHSNSERAALGRVAERLGAALAGLTVLCSAADRDPFEVR
ncbi:MAG: Nif3-like dinuclear metal center hexameric protein [Myxococcales bacterium]|nr:Nif3-like dinuclear metal center hexameric protein [Myxococcales bacterium]